MVANLTVVFVAAVFTPKKHKFLPQMGGSIVEPRYPQTEKCIKHRGLQFSIMRNIGANTKKHKKKTGKEISTISTRTI